MEPASRGSQEEEGYVERSPPHPRRVTFVCLFGYCASVLARNPVFWMVVLLMCLLVC
jgi:hypothetical protein